jgi:hypothetical protein
MLPLAMSAAFFTFFSYLLAKLRMGVLFGEYFEIYAHLSLVCIPMVIGA